MIPLSKEEYNRYIEQLETEKNLPQMYYWQPPESDYSKLIEKLRMQQMNKGFSNPTPTEYKLSSFKYMGHLETKENPPEVYWQPSEPDYSKLTEKLRLQKMNRE